MLTPTDPKATEPAPVQRRAADAVVWQPTLADRLGRLLGLDSEPRAEERARLTARIEEAERRFRQLFETARDGVLLCNASGTIVECNAAAAELLGETRERLAGAPLQAYFKQKDRRVRKGFTDGPALAYRSRRWSFPIDVRVAEIELDGQPCALVYLRDLREQQSRLRAQDRLARMASFDALTNLPNRAQFRARLQRAMDRSRESGRAMALMFLDLDRFKVVNDSLGHEAGDRLLLHVADTLTRTLRSIDRVDRVADLEQFTLSRLGGDEFTVIAEAVGTAEDAGMIARRMLEALSAPFTIGEEEIVISASIGISMYPTDDVDLDGLIRHADMAMYRSKSMGRNTFAFFSDDLDAVVSARLSLEGSLRRALQREEFLLHYQPKADLRTGEVTGVEALLRWDCPGRGMVPPDRFISVLEDTGLILQIGAWVLRTGCAQLAAWDRQGLPPLRLAVNLSARQFRQPHLSSLIEETLREHVIAPERLELELTESLLMEDNDLTRGMLAEFARIGVKVAIDDFGTGHSSLSYLKRFSVDTLKIDRSFVSALPDSPEDSAIAEAVVALGRTMRMRVVAEGVETAAQAEFLTRLGCDEMQGYLLSGPKPVAAFEDWLHEHLHGEQEARRVPVVGSPEAPLPVIQLQPGTAAVRPGPIEVLSPMSELGQPPVAWPIDGDGRRPAAWCDSLPGQLVPVEPDEPGVPVDGTLAPSRPSPGAAASEGSQRRLWRPRQARRPTTAGPVKARRGSIPDPVV